MTSTATAGRNPCLRQLFEGGVWAPYGYALRDAKTGIVIYGGYTGKDTGRGMVGDVDPNHKGLETWAVGFWTAAGEKIGTTAPGTNMNIKWSADMTFSAAVEQYVKAGYTPSGERLREGCSQVYGDIHFTARQ